jgi:hypothetical protein
MVEPNGVANNLGRKAMTFVADNHALIVIDAADCQLT